MSPFTPLFSVCLSVCLSVCISLSLDVDILETYPSIGSAISCAVASSAANFLQQPLFLYLASNFCSVPPDSFSMPLPFVSVVAGGGGGKLRVKEFLVGSFPSCSLEEQVAAITSVHTELGRILSAKQGVRNSALVSGTLIACLSSANTD